jgi:hypothetical protein
LVVVSLARQALRRLFPAQPLLSRETLLAPTRRKKRDLVLLGLAVADG